MTSFSQQLRKICLRTCQALDTPRALSVAILIRYEEWDQLLSLRIDPSVYLDTVSTQLRFARDYAATELVRKAGFVPSSHDRPRAAVDGFFVAERMCKRTNLRLRSLQDGSLRDSSEVRALSILESARKIIGDVLGRLPDTLDCRFGPGAVFESQSWPEAKSLTVMDKINLDPSVTPSAELVTRFLCDGSSWDRHMVQTGRRPRSVRGNRFTTVPKDATKDRGICVEPGLNVWAQLGMGKAIRIRLARVGIDLDDGQPVHNELARLGSIHGGLATIDLSSASDTVSLELVKRLVPGLWLDVLLALRSPYTRLNGQWHRLEKFSSMGNGFTFELETLVFYALARASGAEFVSVYGDDIVVESEAAANVVATLRFFGFETNSAKTFVSGPFRESCGGDYFLGWKCSPARIRKDPASPPEWIDLANMLWSLSESCRCRDILSARAMAISQLPAQLRRVRGPRTLGGLVIWTSEPFWVPLRRRRSSGIDFIRVIRPIPYRIHMRYFPPTAQLAGALLGVPSDGPTPRGAYGWKLGWKAWS